MNAMIEAIKNRTSVRSYADEPLGREKKQIILNLLDSIHEGPLGFKLRFALIDFSETDKKEARAPGTYGFISGAKSYIVCVIKDIPGEGGAGAYADAGYCFEKVILAATGLGLGTCWLGGTFDRASFTKSVKASEDEIVPAISPIGYAHHRRTVLDSAVRRFAGSDRRKPWAELFFEGDLKTPLTGSSAGVYQSPLECVRLGPSASNKQPWRVVYQKQERALHFYLKRTSGYNKFHEKVDIQLLDIGIAMCHFELAAREKGLGGKWETADPGLLTEGTEYVVTWKESG